MIRKNKYNKTFTGDDSVFTMWLQKSIAKYGRFSLDHRSQFVQNSIQNELVVYVETKFIELNL